MLKNLGELLLLSLLENNAFCSGPSCRIAAGRKILVADAIEN